MNACEATLAALDQPLQLDRLATSVRRGRRTASRASDFAAKGLLGCAGRTETKISQRLAREPLVWRRRTESHEAAPAAAATARGGSIQPPHEGQAPVALLRRRSRRLLSHPRVALPAASRGSPSHTHRADAPHNAQPLTSPPSPLVRVPSSGSKYRHAIAVVAAERPLPCFW